MSRSCDPYNPNIQLWKELLLQRGYCRRIGRGLGSRRSINFHCFHFQFSRAIWGGVKLAKEQITIWRQRPGLTAAREAKRSTTHMRGRGEKEAFLLVISRNEPTVIWQWQSDEMCEFGKRRCQDKGTNPESTSETTANSDRALIIS